MDPRFNAIEEKITFVEHQLGELDGVVRDLGQTLDQISRRLDRLAERVDRQTQANDAGETGDAKAGADGTPSDDQLKQDRPPHW